MCEIRNDVRDRPIARLRGARCCFAMWPALSLAGALAAACGSSATPDAEQDLAPASPTVAEHDAAPDAQHGDGTDGSTAAADGSAASLPDASAPRLADPASPADWQVDWQVDDLIDTIAVGPEGRVWIGGRLGLLAERQDDGSWQKLDLDELLSAYNEPRGEWQQFLVDGDDLWIAGALGFYHGGAVRRRGGTWAIEYDERRDTPDFAVGGPLANIARASDGSVVLPVDGQLVRREAGGAWQLVPPEDRAVMFGGAAAAGGRVVGLGEHVYELEDAATGRWRQRAATMPAGVYALSAALDGDQLYAVGITSANETRAFAGTLDELIASSPQPSTLRAVAVLAPGDVWAVGTVYRYEP